MAITDKKVTLNLVGLDGNAFVLMGTFAQRARKEGWTKVEIDGVINEAKSKDYDHLLCVLMNHCECTPGDEDEDEFSEAE